MRRSSGRVRLAIFVVALSALGALGFFAARAAFAGPTCMTDGDVGLCVSWAPNGFATHLTVGVTSGTVSSFTFAPATSSVFGVGGNGACSAVSGQVLCTGPGSVDLLSSPAPVLGDQGTLTVKDGTGTAQPPVAVTLQPGSVSTSTSTSTPSSTTTAPPPTRPTTTTCASNFSLGSGGTWATDATRRVVRRGTVTFVPVPLAQRRFVYTDIIYNRAPCTATGVVVSDPLPATFECQTLDIEGQGTVPCSGTGVTITQDWGDIRGFGGSRKLEIAGRFTAPGTVSNTPAYGSTNLGSGSGKTFTITVTGP